MKTVLVTGGSRGIGKAICREFSKNGWHVVICYNKSEKEAILLSDELGGTPVKVDITDYNSIKNMHDKLSSLGIHIDCIVNNAGISEESLFLDISEEMWDRIFAVNTKGAFLISKEFLPDMINKKQGSIINISSIWGEVGASAEVHYSASKAAIIGMTKALAKELAPSGIRVNCITPGYVDTDMNNNYSKETVAEITEEIPLGRIASPDDIAGLTEFLASEKASYITGQIIGVNGGWNI